MPAAPLRTVEVTPLDAPEVVERGRPLREGHGAAVMGYVVLACAFFSPVLLHFRTRMLADPGDGATFAWNAWHLPHALLGGHNPFVTHDIFYPVGAGTAFSTNIPLESLLSWPLAQLFGLTVAVNILQLTAVVLTGVATYLLALHQCGNRGAAFFAGVAFTYIPYRFVHVAGHHNLNHTELLPLGIWALLLLYERPTRKRALGLGLVVVATLYTDLYYTFFLALALLIVAVWDWRRTFSRKVGVRLVQALVLVALVSSPLLWAMADNAAAGWVEPLRGWGGAPDYSANLISWVTPYYRHPVWGQAFYETNRIYIKGEGVAFGGWLAPLLGLVGAIVARRRQRRLWVAVAAVFGLLSLGPFLQVLHHTGTRFHYLGYDFTYPLPYFLLHFVPVVNGLRVPARFSLVAILALDVLAAIALAHLVRARPRLKWMVGVALAVTLFEMLPSHIPTLTQTIPEPYSAIAASPDPGAVLEIPVQWRTGFGGHPGDVEDTSIFMYYATRHGKPLVSGMVARYPDSKLEELKHVAIYREILSLQDAEGYEDVVANFEPADLRAAGIGFVVYHRDHVRIRSLGYFLHLGMPVLADDGTVLVWKVP